MDFLDNRKRLKSPHLCSVRRVEVILLLDTYVNITIKET